MQMTLTPKPTLVPTMKTTASTMHRRCVRRWRWLAFASMWAGFCCVDLALGVNLGCLGHLQPYVGPTMAALCLAAVLHWVIVWWDDLTETTQRL